MQVCICENGRVLCQVQLVWHAIKAALRTRARRGDKLLPFLLKFRDVVERLSHHLMLERLVAVSEAGSAFRGSFLSAGCLSSCR